MYILKNAFVSILRNKGRNILIAIIIIVIAATCTITLAIRESALRVVTAYENKNPVEATIGMDRVSLMNSLKEGDKSQEEMINAFNEIKGLSEDEIISYGTSDYIKEYYYTYSLGVNAEDIDEATDSLVKEKTEVKTETSTNTWGNRWPEGRPNGPGGMTTNKKTTTTTTEKIFNEKAQNGAFTLVGYNSYEDMKDFVNGEYTIIDGVVSEDFKGNNCVISEELASLNDLKVGDTITVIDTKNEDNTYELKITGIYKENTESSDNMSKMFSNSANEIITNVNLIKTILTNEDLSATITPTFILNNKEDIDAFNNEVKEKGLSEYYKLEDNIEKIESATTSIENVKTFATTFLIITLIIGGIVLIVINMINIRERKYEIGVLRTIGMKKIKLSLQFLMELLIVCILSLSIGGFIGSFASVPVANNLLESEIKNSENEYSDINKNFGRPDEINMNEINRSDNKNDKPNFGVANINQVDTINAVVDFKILAELFGIGILLTVIGSLASMVSISRFSPLTILKERS